MVIPFKALRNICHKNQSCSEFVDSKVPGDLSTAGKGKGVVLGMSLCSVELQHEVSFVSSDHPLLVEMLVVTFVKEKMEPDRLKVQECDSCFVPLSMICEPCLPCLRHVCKALDKYPSGMEVTTSVMNKCHIFAEQPALVEGPCPCNEMNFNVLLSPAHSMIL